MRIKNVSFEKITNLNPNFPHLKCTHPTDTSQIIAPPKNSIYCMESTDIPGTIKVTEEVVKMMDVERTFNKRGSIDIKDKGMMTYFLVGSLDTVSRTSNGFISTFYSFHQNLNHLSISRHVSSVSDVYSIV